jgi:CitMHS family citrate-Mg2+:H+ or citrate-Ca2+:H+ symporter
MLASPSFVTMVVLLTAVLAKRMSAPGALIAIPIIAALVGGFGMGSSKFPLSRRWR